MLRGAAPRRSPFTSAPVTAGAFFLSRHFVDRPEFIQNARAVVSYSHGSHGRPSQVPGVPMPSAAASLISSLKLPLNHHLMDRTIALFA
jgi:hypothetical protein